MGTTIRDVARAASVSIGTVSRALKNQPGLSDATRVRVVEAARQLGYDAAQLRPRIRRLTFLLHRQHNNFTVSPFFSHVLHGVEDACRERGIVPSLLTAGPTEDELTRGLAQAEAHFVYRLQTVGGFSGKSDQLNAYNVYVSDPGYFTEDLARYRRLLLADLRDAARLLTPQRRVALSVVPAGRTELALRGSSQAVVS